jgi:hypothetical protein
LLEYDLEIKPTKLIKGQGLEKLMTQSNYDVLGINFIADLSENSEEETVPQVSQKFLESPWYADIIYVLRNLQAPPELSKTKARFLKLKATKFCILDHSLYWKDPGGILLSCLLEDEVKQTIKEFHKGDYGGHHYWKTTVHKILRAGFYWPSIFSDVYKEVSSTILGSADMVEDRSCIADSGPKVGGQHHCGIREETLFVYFRQRKCEEKEYSDIQQSGIRGSLQRQEKEDRVLKMLCGDYL